MNIFEQQGLALLAAEQGRHQLNQDMAKVLRRWSARVAIALRRARRRVFGHPIRY